MFQLLNHFEIGEIEVFGNISVSPFNFANISSKHIANLAASNVPNALRKHCTYSVFCNLLPHEVFLTLIDAIHFSCNYNNNYIANIGINRCHKC